MFCKSFVRRTSPRPADLLISFWPDSRIGQKVRSKPLRILSIRTLGGKPRIGQQAPVEAASGEIVKLCGLDENSGSFMTRSKGAKNGSLARRFLISAIVSFAMLPSCVHAIDITLADLLAGGEIVSGDKRMFGFTNYEQSGDLNIDASTIDVFPISSVAIDGSIEYGIRFQRAAVWELAGPNLLYDMSLDFQVEPTIPSHKISDNTLEFTGNHVGGGEAHLVEGVTDFQTSDTLANKEVYINIGNTGLDKLIDHQIFSHPARVIQVSKDFQLQTRSGALDNIFVSHFDQTFSEVHTPEPGTVILVAFSGLVLAGYGRMKRRERKIQ